MCSLSETFLIITGVFYNPRFYVECSTGCRRLSYAIANTNRIAVVILTYSYENDNIML